MLTKPDQVLPAGNSGHAIPFSEIEAAAAFQNTEFRQGDILIVRTGYMAWYKYVPETLLSSY